MPLHYSLEDLEKKAKSQTEQMIERIKSISAKSDRFEKQLLAERRTCNEQQNELEERATQIDVMSNTIRDMTASMEEAAVQMQKVEDEKEFWRSETARIKALIDERGPRDEDLAEQNRLQARVASW